MTTREKTRVVFTQIQMDALVDAMHADPIAGFVTMWDIIEPRYIEGGIPPWDYEVSHEQQTILFAAMKAGCEPNGLSVWAGAMSIWLNQGPATEGY